ncbi:MAG: BON domain-containing protein [Planctomycetota bacterium]
MANKSTNTIVNKASAALAGSPFPELRGLSVQATRIDGQSEELQLRGRVRSFYHKQLAQEAIFPIAGTMQVVNDLDVSS